MAYYSFFNTNNELLGCDNNEMIKDGAGEDVINTEIPEELYLDYKEHPNKYIAGEKEIEVEVPDEIEEDEEQTYHTEFITVPYPVLNPNYDTEQAELRETNFKKEFFKVNNFGWYRKQPKGYQSAVESMNVLFNIANVAQGIQAGLVIFYQEPDFTKPEECTEEWLINHQIVMPAMTLQEFMQLYVAFMTAWNTEEHE